MQTVKRNSCALVLIVVFHLSGSACVELPIAGNYLRRGRYIPELHGADQGKYVPDLRGKYHHIDVPYDGGYGDRGLKYVHDVQRILQGRWGILPLGPNDHLRFMIDFNYNGTGWQILQFEWLRDGETTPQFHYINENKLWENNDNAVNEYADRFKDQDSHTQSVEEKDAGESKEQMKQEADKEEQQSESATDDETLHVHVDGSYGPEMYTIIDNEGAEKSSSLHDAIAEVLDYIKRYILPTL